MKLGLKMSSPMRRNSASGLVNDCPSMPKETAATTCEAIQSGQSGAGTISEC